MKTDNKIITYAQVPKIVKALRNKGKRICFTSGCYDLLHLGHVLHFNFCKKHGDILIVNVGNDETVRDLKGPGRPILPANVRARTLSALEIIDYVVISEEAGKMDHSELISIVKPAVYVVNATDSHIKEKYQISAQVGTKLLLTRRTPPKDAKGISSTLLAQKLNKI